MSDRMKLYISGQISGRPYGEARLDFGTAAQTLAGLGFEVFNPMQGDYVLGMSRAELMKDDIRELLECDGVALLPGWQASSGARVEKAVADECGIVVAEYERWVELPYREDKA